MKVTFHLKCLIPTTQYILYIVVIYSCYSSRFHFVGVMIISRLSYIYMYVMYNVRVCTFIYNLHHIIIKYSTHASCRWVITSNMHVGSTFNTITFLAHLNRRQVSHVITNHCIMLELGCSITISCEQTSRLCRPKTG